MGALSELAQAREHEREANHASILLDDVLDEECDRGNRFEIDVNDARGSSSKYIERISLVENSHLHP